MHIKPSRYAPSCDVRERVRELHEQLKKCKLVINSHTINQNVISPPTLLLIVKVVWFPSPFLPSSMPQKRKKERKKRKKRKGGGGEIVI